MKSCQIFLLFLFRHGGKCTNIIVIFVSHSPKCACWILVPSFEISHYPLILHVHNVSLWSTVFLHFFHFLEVFYWVGISISNIIVILNVQGWILVPSFEISHYLAIFHVHNVWLWGRVFLHFFNFLQVFCWLGWGTWFHATSSKVGFFLISFIFFRFYVGWGHRFHRSSLS